MKDAPAIVTMAPLLLRGRDVADALAVSESLIAIFVRRGWLTPVRIPGIRATRFARQEVEDLAAKIRAGSLDQQSTASSQRRAS